MHKLEAHIDQQLQHLEDRFFFVACSGGVDSIVLLYILKKLGYSVRVLHMNYQLRGKESDMDAQFVRRFAQSIKVETLIKTVDLKAELRDGGNLQDKARQHRYWWFYEMIQSHTNVKVALAHHRNDQVETFFLNLARKSGFMGLSAMPFERNGIVRPMLDITKAELIAYAREHHLKWRDDSSNLESKYKRNMLRNIVLPELRKELPSLDESVSVLIDVFQRNQKELEEKVLPYVQMVRNEGFISLQAYDEMNEFEAIEFFHQLEIPHTVVFEIKRMKRKGAAIDLPDWVPDYTLIAFEGDGYSFIDNQYAPLPELHEEVVASLPDTYDKNSVYFDHYALSGDLHIRPWKTGDRIAPIGMKGTQLVSDIIYKAGLRRKEKESVTVVHDDEHILWIPGLKVGRHALANKDSKEILKVWITPRTAQ